MTSPSQINANYLLFNSRGFSFFGDSFEKEEKTGIIFIVNVVVR
jgi:hypothetical protein